MDDESTAFSAGLVIGIMVSTMVFVLISQRLFSSYRQQAVRLGFAEWKVELNGDTEFTWKQPCQEGGNL